MRKSLLSNKVKVDIAIENIRLGSNLTTKKTLRSTKKSIFNTILGFTQSHSGVLGRTERFIQMIAGTYKSDKPNNNRGVDKVHLKYDCFNCSIVNGIRKPILYSFTIDKLPGPKI